MTSKCSNCGKPFTGSAMGVLDGNPKHQTMCMECSIKFEHELIRKQTAKEIFKKLESKINDEQVKTKPYDWHIGAMWGLNRALILMKEILEVEK